MTKDIDFRFNKKIMNGYQEIELGTGEKTDVVQIFFRGVPVAIIDKEYSNKFAKIKLCDDCEVKIGC